MSTAGSYLYGFTGECFRPGPEMRGLAGAQVNALAYRDIAAVVSAHPVERLIPKRSHLEPHHRIVRQISSQTTLVPAAFGHISDSESEILGVLRGNYDAIRQELARLDRKCEMSLKLCWNVTNIFEFFVRHDRALRELRDRVFSRREPSVPEKIELGGKFEAALARERERLTNLLLGVFSDIASDTSIAAPRNELVVCQAALLVDRTRPAEFQDLLRRAACLFDQNYTLEYGGPWPAYSFVQLRLEAASAAWQDA